MIIEEIGSLFMTIVLIKPAQAGNVVIVLRGFGVVGGVVGQIKLHILMNTSRNRSNSPFFINKKL